MNKLLAHHWISAPIGAVVYLIATFLFWQKPVLPARHNSEALVQAVGPSWDFNNPEADQLIAELKIEKKSVEQRQQQLDDLATRLNTERAELGQVIQSVRQTAAGVYIIAPHKKPEQALEVLQSLASPA